MRRLLILVLSVTVGFVALSPAASGYYNWVYFANRTGPFNPIPVKFDLSALPDSQTVSYFISDQGPSPMMPADSFQSLVSEIRRAAEVWNHVPSSSLRLAFGGISDAATLQSTPGIDIVFDDDMPPGILAQSRPATAANLSGLIASGASFVPIMRSRMQLRKDLTVYQQASYYDSFYLTIVHEFGHTLGLQHTLTSGVMSTSITRATTKAQPLSPDDVAGLSLLYPVPGYGASVGSISGSVSINGTGVNLASVVAISAGGVAISGMTNPDGTYRIAGIPTGQYYVYAHPLPPPAEGEATPDNIVPPEDPSGNPFLANTGFDTEFFPGTRDWTQAALITVNAGNTAAGVNFNLQSRSGPAVYDMVTYGYQGDVAVQAPPFQSGTRTYLVFFAYGTVVNNNQLAPGLNVTVIGGTAQVEAGTLQYWTGGYLIAVVDTKPVTSATPVALAITVNNDMYVLPAAFTVVPSLPPTISSVTPGLDGQGNMTGTIAGSNIGASTRILFDGVSASLLNVNKDGSLLVSAPPASSGYQAAVEALTTDGQTSSQALGSAEPIFFAYNGPANPAISVNPASIVAGTDAMVTVTGDNTTFVEGQTAIAFGSSDIFVRQAWVVGPGTMLADVSASGTAPATLSSISIVTGLQLSTLSMAFQILAANPGQASLHTPIVNQITQLAGVPVGGIAVINSSGLPASLAGWTLTIANEQTGFSIGNGGQIYASVPNGILTGPSVVQLSPPGGTGIPPVLMQVDPPPPTITAATNSSGAAVSASNPVNPGGAVTLAVSGLANSNDIVPAAQNVQINIGGVNQVAEAVSALPGSQGLCVVQFVVPSNLAGGNAIPLTVGVGTRVSAAYFIAVQ